MFKYLKKVVIARKIRKLNGPLKTLPPEMKLFIIENSDTIADLVTIIHTTYTDITNWSRRPESKSIINEIQTVVKEILNDSENNK